MGRLVASDTVMCMTKYAETDLPEGRARSCSEEPWCPPLQLRLLRSISWVPKRQLDQLSRVLTLSLAEGRTIIFESANHRLRPSSLLKEWQK